MNKTHFKGFSVLATRYSCLVCFVVFLPRIHLFCQNTKITGFSKHDDCLLPKIFIETGLGSSVGRVSAPRSGGTGFDPGPRQTKVVNNGTSCSPLGTRIFGLGQGLVAPMSV